jgi:uncharacterized RDD family membrane protein YckC
MPPPPQPSGSWQPSYGGPSGPRAGFGIRLAAWFLDGLVLGSVNGIIQLATDQVVSTVTGIVLGILYATYFIGSPSGQTIGMRAVSIRVIDTQTGGRVDYGRCVVRYVVGIVSGLACLLGYFWMLWDPEKQTWHDKAAGTFVVPVASYPVERWPG